VKYLVVTDLILHVEVQVCYHLILEQACILTKNFMRTRFKMIEVTVHRTYSLIQMNTWLHPVTRSKIYDRNSWKKNYLRNAAAKKLPVLLVANESTTWAYPYLFLMPINLSLMTGKSIATSSLVM
jgi:hypothetical protein